MKVVAPANAKPLRWHGPFLVSVLLNGAAVAAIWGVVVAIDRTPRTPPLEMGMLPPKVAEKTMPPVSTPTVPEPIVVESLAPDAIVIPPPEVLSTPPPPPLAVLSEPVLPKDLFPVEKKAVVRNVPPPPRPAPSPPREAARPTVRPPQPAPRSIAVGPRLSRSIPPAYPAAAKRAKREGDVRVSFVVDPRGRVVDVRVVGSSGHSDLDASALRAVRGWRFQPARLASGEAVSFPVEQTVQFRLR